MIDREFTKRIRLLNGRHETIKTKFELEAGRLVEHVELQTFDRPAHADGAPSKAPSAT
jgi:hypothetical protein